VTKPTWRSTAHGIAFLGFLGVPENELAVRRLVERVWPAIESEMGPTPLTVIGRGHPNG